MKTVAIVGCVVLSGMVSCGEMAVDAEAPPGLHPVGPDYGGVGPELSSDGSSLVVQARPYAGDFDFVSFGRKIEGAARGARAAGGLGCAEVMPAMPVRGPLQAGQVARDFVAHEVGELELKAGPTLVCGKAGARSCARWFLQFVYSYDGVTGQALWPLALVIDAAALAPEVNLWARADQSYPAISIHGTVGGRLLGILFVQDTAQCKRPAPPPPPRDLHDAPIVD